jgi:hypothetical protein
LGHVQFAIDERVAPRGDEGKEDAHLAVFHAPGESAILESNARRVAAAFEEAAFIDDMHREDLRGYRRGGEKRRRVQALADQGTQIIADAVFVPDGL